jgi:hypothetical protein
MGWVSGPSVAGIHTTVDRHATTANFSSRAHACTTAVEFALLSDTSVRKALRRCRPFGSGLAPTVAALAHLG